MKTNYSLLKLIFLFILFASFSAKGQIHISNRSSDKVIVFGNGKLSFTLDYDLKCVVTEMKVNGESVLSNESGIYSGFRSSTASFSTCKLHTSPKIETKKDRVTLSGIRYGEDDAFIDEVWTFIITDADIRLDIERSVSEPVVVQEVSFPSVNFKSISTWNGAFTDYGGLAWFYLFNEKLCTYGVHSNSSVFWNSTTGNGLKISVSAPGKQAATKFTRTNEDKLEYTVSVGDGELKYRYDSDTKRRRFIRGKTDVWDSFTLSPGKYKESVTFSWVNYNEEYNRGNLTGINGRQVSDLANTIARIGVIDARHFGGNSWHTPYGPICLHEQYIGQMGIAINDPDYTEGYKKCLDYYRDNAIKPDGRVFSRWAYDNSDMMKGEVTPLGFYEAQWGYLFDSNTDLTINVCQLYNLSGDLEWVRTHKKSCETTLEYLLKRDSNKNNLVEMMTDSHSEKRGSDWIDIIWASFENAFINAKLYYALIQWADVEKQLGDTVKASYYVGYAAKLKNSFNKTTEEGGFWDRKNKWFVHWRDKDNSVHGNNLVTPVNFMAIAYGICDDSVRYNTILNKIESQMKMENLFFWPICLYPYQPDEGLDYQFPFPYYENGDIFLSWGAVGVEAYASHQPELALKYIENILSRYEKDGLAFQRYGRIKQDGLGDDILSGNSLAIVGLYKSIYGINPLYNRLYLNPHIPGKLSGTTLNYKFRGEKLIIKLDKEKYSVSNPQFKLSSKNNFGFNSKKNELQYFNSNNATYSLKANVAGSGNLSIEVVEWNENECVWNQVTSPDTRKITYSVCQLKPENKYAVFQDGKIVKTINSSKEGSLDFEVNAKSGSAKLQVQLLNE